MTIEELNDAIADGSIGEVVRVAEARQCKALSKIADIVCGRPGIRLILVAGGSSAGKTTTAKRLATQIRVNGREVVHLSTDDYFVGDARNPRDENGELDFENLDAVICIGCVIQGETRHFEFICQAVSQGITNVALKHERPVIFSVLTTILIGRIA